MRNVVAGEYRVCKGTKESADRHSKKIASNPLNYKKIEQES
jgi:hypothetical protein